MTLKMRDRVTVAHDQGTERGTIIGVQRDPATGEVAWVRVEFGDRTTSAWPVSKVERVPAEALTLDDLERALADERHLGYGFAVRYQITNRRRRESLERAIVRKANALGLDYEALFAWTNSKFARWVCDEATFPERHVNDIVANYLTPTFVRVALEG